MVKHVLWSLQNPDKIDFLQAKFLQITVSLLKEMNCFSLSGEQEQDYSPKGCHYAVLKLWPRVTCIR